MALSDAEILQIHRALWNAERVVEIQGHRYVINIVDTRGKKYTAIYGQQYNFVTQNTKKDSGPAAWVKAKLGRRLTWIIPRYDSDAKWGSIRTDENGKTTIKRPS